MCVSYTSNNSGGSWWLSDQNWKDLEAAGWIVDWITDSDMPYKDKDGRWLGALAKHATREGLSLFEAVNEWEQVTGLSSTDAGCPCCGAPHYFEEQDEAGNFVASGPETHYEARW